MAILNGSCICPSRLQDSSLGGAVLVYFDAKQKEDVQTKIGQLERMLEVERKEKEKQESLTRDATDRGHLLREQLQAKTEQLSKVLKDKPEIDGDIRSVRLFPWQRASELQHRMDDMPTATGVLVDARIENWGAGTTLANWELTIQLPDNTIIRAQKWPVKKPMRIVCEDARLTISSDEYLDRKSQQAVQRTEERSGVTIWMVKDMPASALKAKNSSYTLTARDDTGAVHALKKFSVASLPQQCSGFEMLD
jgi:hypothetical protein